jgi:cyclophilin family peptidyl-prolyl cis-trans isomerase
MFREHNIVPRGRVLFVGNVGEEGPGNLRGMRWLFEHEYRGQIDYFISVDGVGANITTRAVGSHRYTITVSGPGGHSFGDFGMPNPTHALGRAIARIANIAVPAQPRTTFNVGIIRGGTSVNSISMSAAMDVDMRSESAAELAAIDRRIRAAVDSAVTDEHRRWPASNVRLQVKYDTIGIRPTGAQSDDAFIVRTAMAAGRAVGFAPRTGASSTDANIPISMGIPGITIDGGGSGDGAHSTGEWYDDGPDGWKGPQWALLLVASLAGVTTGTDALWLNPANPEWATPAPPVAHLRFETSKGVFVLELVRAWGPIGADRLYNLVRLGRMNDTRFHRVNANYIVQWGLHGDSAVNAAWRNAYIRDDPPRSRNARGTFAFSMKPGQPHTRNTQIYVNLADNARNDAEPFTILGTVIEGMSVLDSLYSGYGENSGSGVRQGRQGPLENGGNAYMDREYPLLDRILRATALEPKPSSSILPAASPPDRPAARGTPAAGSPPRRPARAEPPHP